MSATLTPTFTISPEHAKYLEDHAVGIDIARTAGVRTAATVEDLPDELRWCADLLPGIVFSHVDATGHTIPQFRPDETAEEFGKYIQPKDSGSGLSIHPGRLELVGKATRVLVVEGTKQALAAATHAERDILVVGIQGCNGWMFKGVPLPDLALLMSRDGAEVTIAFDADVKKNRNVFDAAKSLGEHMDILGAMSVKFLSIPVIGKAGLDDYLAALPEQMRAGTLSKLIERASALPARAPAAVKAHKVIRARIAAEVDWERAEISKPAPMPGDPSERYAAFAARIVRSTAIEDDLNDKENREKTITHDLEVCFEPDGEIYVVAGVPNRDLEDVMAWLERLPGTVGTEADWRTDQSARERIAEAIRATAQDEREAVRAFRRTGPVTLGDGTRGYLHAGGVLTAIGNRMDARGELDSPLSHISFPDPTVVPDAVMQSAARAIVDSLKQFKDKTTATLGLSQLAWTASGARIRSSVIVFGDSGSGKTCTAKYLASYESPRFAVEQMMSGEDTKGALGAAGEGLHHATMIVDDVQRARNSENAEADAEDGVDRILRRAFDGGSAGRGRLMPDPARKGKYIHLPADLSDIGAIIMGEHPPQNPGTESGIARAISTNVAVGSLLASSESERNLLDLGASGKPQLMMAGLIVWMLNQDEDWIDGIEARALKLGKALKTQHHELLPRTAGIAGRLTVGWQIWTEYLGDVLGEDLAALSTSGSKLIEKAAIFHATQVLGQKQQPHIAIIDRIQQVLAGESSQWFIGGTSAPTTEPDHPDHPDLRRKLGVWTSTKTDDDNVVEVVALIPDMVVKALPAAAARDRLDGSKLQKRLAAVAVKGSDGRLTRSVRIEGKSVRAICIPLDIWNGDSEKTSQSDGSATTNRQPGDSGGNDTGGPVVAETLPTSINDLEEVDA